MKTLGRILEGLKHGGFRITTVRRAMIEAFMKACPPVSADELMARLKKRGIRFNKTTVYRELAFLREMKVIQEVQFLHERVKRYELFERSVERHHHHLVCLRCRKVEDIDMENELETQEREIYRAKGFKVLEHSLEFHGLCSECHLL